MIRKRQERLRINDSIRAHELRVIEDNGSSKIMSKKDALIKARGIGLDLIEISAKANPPVAKITDYGKFKYEQKKKQSEIKSKSKVLEVKNIQIKIGTHKADLMLKAKRAKLWLEEGHRLKAELYLRGRSKYMDKKFLHDRLNNVLSFIDVDYKIVESFKDSPKGITIIIEAEKKGKKKEDKEKNKKPIEILGEKAKKNELKRENNESIQEKK